MVSDYLTIDVSSQESYRNTEDQNAESMTKGSLGLMGIEIRTGHCWEIFTATVETAPLNRWQSLAFVVPITTEEE